MFSFLFEMHKVDEMNLAFGWVVHFLKLNGIDYMPLVLEFLFNTLGLASWIFFGLTLYSAMIGYSKQMSHFFFLLEHSLGKKLDAPYKWCFIFGGLWASTHVMAFWLAIIGVYLYQDAVMLALITFLTGVSILIVVTALSFIVPRKLKAKREREAAPVAPTAPPPPPVYEQREKIAAPEKPKIAGPEKLRIGQQNKGPKPQPTGDAEFDRSMQLLGLKRGFTESELKKKYRALAKKVHADTGGSDVLYLQVKKAYEYLLARIS